MPRDEKNTIIRILSILFFLVSELGFLNPKSQLLTDHAHPVRLSADHPLSTNWPNRLSIEAVRRSQKPRDRDSHCQRLMLTRPLMKQMSESDLDLIPNHPCDYIAKSLTRLGDSNLRLSPIVDPSSNIDPTSSSSTKSIILLNLAVTRDQPNLEVDIHLLLGAVLVESDCFP